MGKQTYYVVLSFEIGKRGKLVEGNPIPATSEQHAVRLAYRMEPKVAGVVAFSKTGDPETGDYDDAIVLAVLGAVPADLMDSKAA